MSRKQNNSRAALDRKYAKARDKRAELGRVQCRERKLRERYGIGIRDFEAIIASQGGHCPCCGRVLDRNRPRAVHVDHDHSTGAIRGVICAGCNVSIGRFGDNADGVLLALRYLRASPTGETVDEHW